MKRQKDVNYGLIIVNDILPYSIEVVNVLAASSNNVCRFRYQKKYIPTIEKYDTLLNTYVVITLRSRKKATFFPLRLAQIVSVKEVGDVVYISVKLGATAAVGSRYIEEKSATFSKIINDAIGSFSNLPNDDLKNLVLLDSEKAYKEIEKWNAASNGDEVTNWGYCIENIMKEYEFGNVDFFKLVDVKENNSGSPVKYLYKSPQKHGYDIRFDSEYTFEILQRTDTGKKGDSSVPGNRFLKFESYSSSLVIPQNTATILGKYDLIRLNFNTGGPKKGRERCQAFIYPDGNTSIASKPTLEVSFIISKSAFQIILNVFFFICFFLVFATYAFLESIVKWPFLQNVSFITNNLPTITKLLIATLIIMSAYIGDLAKELTSKFKLS